MILPRIVRYIYNRFKIRIAFTGKRIIKTKWAILREIASALQNDNPKRQHVKPIFEKGLILVLCVLLLDVYIVYAIAVQFSPEYIIKDTFFLLLKRQNNIVIL